MKTSSMDKDYKAIKKTKRKFLLFSIVGISLLLFVSAISLSSYNRAIENHKSIQNFYNILGKHLLLVNSIASNVDEFDEFPTKNKLSEISPKFIRSLKGLKKENDKLKELFKKQNHSSFEKLENFVESKNFNVILSDFLDKSEKALVLKGDSLTKVRKNLRLITKVSRNKLISIFNYISKKALQEQTRSLEKLQRSGFLFAILFFAQVLLMWFLIFKPIYSKMLEQNDKLLKTMLESKSASRSKTDFLANISHEIRTPMTAILGYAELLKRDEGSRSEQSKSIDIINENAEHLLSLVDEILDISKIEAGKFECDLEVLNLVEFIEEVYNLVKVKAEEKSIKLNLENSSAIPEFVDADPKRLKQILINLIGNAIKFTEKGKVTINVSYIKETNKLVVKVIDTGIGISRENMANLFKPFSQGDTSVSREHGGTGLGLVLSRGLAIAMNGDIKILESRVGVGTTFALTLDAGNAATRKLIYNFEKKITPKENEFIFKDRLKEKNILVVDDAKENARLFCIYLSSAGANVTVANGGEEALNKYNENSFDMILLDLQMPGMDGFQTIKALRNLGYERPIIALTAHAMKEEKERTAKAGFDDHITKPVTSEFLINSVVSNLNV